MSWSGLTSLSFMQQEGAVKPSHLSRRCVAMLHAKNAVQHSMAFLQSSAFTSSLCRLCRMVNRNTQILYSCFAALSGMPQALLS